MSFEMDFQVVAARESASAVLALVAFVAGVELNMPIAAPFVLEFSITKIANELGGRQGICR